MQLKRAVANLSFSILTVVPSIFPNPVKNNQQMLKTIFIVLIELPRHVSASKYHLQGVTLSFQVTPVFSLRFGWMWAIVHSVWPFAAECIPQQMAAPETQTKNWSSLQGKCNPLKMAFGCRNMPG
jgi:hypothetical protein